MIRSWLGGKRLHNSDRYLQSCWQWRIWWNACRVLASLFIPDGLSVFLLSLPRQTDFSFCIRGLCSLEKQVCFHGNHGSDSLSSCLHSCLWIILQSELCILVLEPNIHFSNRLLMQYWSSIFTYIPISSPVVKVSIIPSYAELQPARDNHLAVHRTISSSV